MTTFTAPVLQPEQYEVGEIILLGPSNSNERFAYEVLSVTPPDDSGIAIAEFRRMPCGCCPARFSVHLAGRLWVCADCYARHLATGSVWSQRSA